MPERMAGVPIITALPHEGPPAHRTASSMYRRLIGGPRQQPKEASTAPRR